MTNQINIKKSKNPETAREYLDRGVESFNAGNLKGAIEDYTRAIAMDPKLTDARIERGVAFHQTGKYTPAIKDFTMALECTRQDTRLLNREIIFNTAEILPLRAAAYNAKGEHREAISDAEKTVAILKSHSRCYFRAPSYLPAIFQLAYAWRKEGDKQDNIRRKHNCYDEAIHNYESYTSAVKKDETVWFWLGFLYFQKEQYVKAEKNYDMAVTLNEKFTDAWLGLGIVSIKRAKWGNAIGCFNKVISLQKDNANAFAGRAHVYFQIKKYDLADEDCKKAIDLNMEGDWFEGIKHPRTVLMDIQEVKDILMKNTANYRKVTDLGDDAQAAPGGDGTWMAENEFDEIIADCINAISENPLNVVNYFKLGDAYVGKGNLDKAIESYDEGIELEENNPVFWKKRGFALLLKGEEENAEEDYLKAFALDPKDPQARDVMEEIRKKREKAVNSA